MTGDFWKEMRIKQERKRYRDAYRREHPEPVGRNAIRTADPIMRELFLIAFRNEVPNSEIARRMDRTRATLSRWKKGGTSATTIDAAAMAEALGYEIVLRKKTDGS